MPNSKEQMVNEKEDLNKGNPIKKIMEDIRLEGLKDIAKQRSKNNIFLVIVTLIMLIATFSVSKQTFIDFILNNYVMLTLIILLVGFGFRWNKKKN